MERQQTLTEIQRTDAFLHLTPSQKSILKLLQSGRTQGNIAKILHLSRSYLSQTCSFFLDNGIIQKKFKAKYNFLYEVAPQLQAKICETQKSVPEEQLTPMRTHNIRRKFKIIEQSGSPSTDPRTGYTKRWKPRGGERFKYWVPGKAGYPSVTIDIHPKTIVCYIDAKQTIIAHTKEEAKEIARVAIYKAKDKFIAEQAKFGITFETDISGEDISRPHVGLAIRENGPLDFDTHIPGTWIDKSLEKELGPGFKEFEMHIDHPMATPLEKGVMAMARVDDTIKKSINDVMPEAMKEFERAFAPLTSEIHTVMAHIQSGQSVQNQINQLVVLVAQLVKDNHDLKKKLEQH